MCPATQSDSSESIELLSSRHHTILVCTPTNKKACSCSSLKKKSERLMCVDEDVEAATNTSIICIKKPATLNGLREVYEHYLVEKSCMS